MLAAFIAINTFQVRQMGIIGKAAKKTGKGIGILLIAKMLNPTDAEAQTRFYGHVSVNFGSPYAYYNNYGYGNLCGPPAHLWQQYYYLYNLYAASPRFYAQPGVVVTQPYYNQPYGGVPPGYYANVPVSRYYIKDGVVHGPEGPVNDGNKIKQLEDEIGRLKLLLGEKGRVPDGNYRPDSEKDTNPPGDKIKDRQRYEPMADNKKEFSYVMRYSGKVCDNQLDDVAIGYMQAIFDYERERTNWGSDYAVYDAGSYKLVVRDKDNKKIGEINLRKYSGKTGREIIPAIGNDLRSMNIVGSESIDDVRVDFRNYSCEN
jgi:hypothetical protein